MDHECQWTGAVMISHIFYSRNPVIIWFRQTWPIAVEKLIGCNFQLNNGKNIWSSLKTQWQLLHLTNDYTVWPTRVASAKQNNGLSSLIIYNW